ncbi:unnamed protein product [Peronospora effusa]|nr:unnamed protein product [Peronospora effusa]
MGKTKRVLGPEIKSLKYFINRTAVLKQYREFLRITKPLAVDVRLDVRRQIRAGFDAYRHEEDVSLLLRQAREQMKMVSDLVDTALAQQRSAVSERDWKKDEWVISTHGAAVASIDTKNTWMDTLSEDKDGQEDVKGRLGNGWPWKRGKCIDILDLQGIKRR